MKKYIYQPLPNERYNDEFIVIRNCKDRSDAMINFTKKYFSDELSTKTFLDIGSSCGYFVNSFEKICKASYGIEKDINQSMIAKLFYKKNKKNIISGDFKEILPSHDQYDIISCLSVLHHFIINPQDDDAAELLKIIDQKTKSILFFEMAEEKEDWYKEKLSGWNLETIPQWVIDNTSFTKYEALVVDNDSVGEFYDNYGRTVFAFYR